MNNDKQVSESGNLVRPHFSPGLLLEDTDLNAGVSYTRDLTRLMFRSLFGCGVICGLKVEAKFNCDMWEIKVAPGLALDCMGDPIEVTKDAVLKVPSENNKFPTVWIAVCYAEWPCRNKDVSCSDNDRQPEPTRIRSGYEVKFYKDLPKCACYCATATEPKPTGHGGGNCGCGEPQQTNGQAAQDPPKPCACYQDHYDGKCDCGCKCCCVIVAKVAPKVENNAATTEPVVTDDMVRFIRPILKGYYACQKEELEKKIKAQTPTNTPPTDPTPAPDGGGGNPIT